MGQDLVDIQPGELKFPFQLKKQSSCSIHLINKTDDCVAFKVKTTSPKRYCVRPNVGVILPRSAFEFTVTMQAQRTAPPDMQLKDKFLVQATVVPCGTADEDILPHIFSKEDGKYIQESKLKVVLVGSSDSPISQHSNGNLKPGFSSEVSPLDGVLPKHSEKNIPLSEDMSAIPNEYFDSLRSTSSDSKELPLNWNKLFNSGKKTSSVNSEEQLAFNQLENAPLPHEELLCGDKLSAGLENCDLAYVIDDVKNLKSKLNTVETKLAEAEEVIKRLRDGTDATNQAQEKLHQEMLVLKRRSPTSRNQVGFPFMFAVYMALLGMLLGYLLRL